VNGHITNQKVRGSITNHALELLQDRWRSTCRFRFPPSKMARDARGVLVGSHPV